MSSNKQLRKEKRTNACFGNQFDESCDPLLLLPAVVSDSYCDYEGDNESDDDDEDEDEDDKVFLQALKQANMTWIQKRRSQRDQTQLFAEPCELSPCYQG